MPGTDSIAGQVIGVAVGGSIGAVVAITLVVVILRWKYSVNCNIIRKRDTSSGQSVADQKYEELSVTTVTSVYDVLRYGKKRQDNLHIYSTLDESSSNSNELYMNVSKEDPINKNTTLKNSAQTMF
ncbi:uncharacterized protein LOC128235270 [Mya arenaria]|uniref:uncharacterized protein LOC128235270 n=1 Tax=Mya arenaria TaxID=6604 RepID=UPI0022E727D7|nr:uncharacterized protein LOC128235270 [Mya arenaria]